MINLIPNIPILTQEITEITYPTKTYRIVGLGSDQSFGIRAISMTASEEYYDRLGGYTDGIDALMQAVYLILSTERYKFIIYSWDYGVELVDLYGKDMPYVMSELPRRIKEALIQDNRVDDVTDFEFEKSGKKLFTKFTVVSDVGNISVALEVAI